MQRRLFSAIVVLFCSHAHATGSGWLPRAASLSMSAADCKRLDSRATSCAHAAAVRKRPTATHARTAWYHSAVAPCQSVRTRFSQAVKPSALAPAEVDHVVLFATGSSLSEPLPTSSLKMTRKRALRSAPGLGAYSRPVAMHRIVPSLSLNTTNYAAPPTSADALQNSSVVMPS